MDFKNITLEDMGWIQECMAKSDYMTSEFCFTNSFIWKDIYKIQAARMGDFVVLKDNEEQPSYLYPAGEGDIRPVIEAMMEDAQKQSAPFVMLGVPGGETEKLQSLFPDRFSYTMDRDHSDYIYSREKLKTLAGKKLHGKRNHINKFKENHPQWSFEAITDQNKDECWQMNKEWCLLNGCKEDVSLREEACAVQNAFTYFHELKLWGGLLRVNGRVVAYTMASRLNSNTVDIHIEKAFADIQGAYPMINQQFILNCCEEYEFVNREDDLGEEGLRKAKLSYYPEILAEKYMVKAL